MQNQNSKEQWVESYSFSFFLYITQHVHIQLCATLCDPHGLQPTSPLDFPGKNAGVGCHFLVQGIFSTQGWNPCLLHLQLCQWVLSHCATWGAPKGTWPPCQGREPCVSFVYQAKILTVNFSVFPNIFQSVCPTSITRHEKSHSLH